HTIPVESSPLEQMICHLSDNCNCYGINHLDRVSVVVRMGLKPQVGSNSHMISNLQESELAIGVELWRFLVLARSIGFEFGPAEAVNGLGSPHQWQKTINL